MSGALPIVMTKDGPVPRTPEEIRAQLIALVSAMDPGYTANLPGSLIEDISSTDVGAILLVDSARVELVNSLTPYGANAFILAQLGQVYGVQQGVGYNTSVSVIFSGTPGFGVPEGFVISDGSHQYATQAATIIGVSGYSDTVFCLATDSGSWSVPANTVTTIVTSTPTGVTLTVNNPTEGLPGEGAETLDQYRVRVLEAGNAASQGSINYIKTLLRAVPGVQHRLVSVRFVNDLMVILVGGGDPYAVASAIYNSVFDLGDLSGSVMLVLDATETNPAVITTNLNHGYATGQAIQIGGMTGGTWPSINSTPLTITVIDETSFSLDGIDATGFGAYTGGGVVVPNLRNVSVTINEYPDSYIIPFVVPPKQDVAIVVTWNTSSPNVVSQAAVAQLAQPALTDYINSIPVGAPINVFELQNVFQLAVASIVPTPLLIRMVFQVSINGLGVSPTVGTGVIAGDPESYFETSVGQITVLQG